MKWLCVRVCSMIDAWVRAVYHADETMQQMVFYHPNVPVNDWLAFVGAPTWRV